ncbi:glutathione S-transferase [Nitratireductor aestuarii]|uniref:Glutathione S-transferase n=1 Tax=Nitratireductor aestuarii TaxID=1735103 RepID=A0A916S5H5_9HYPH|nr:glutathione S-transferase [Nitratireductor aestuarii]GGA82006.1 glutathione S-transferase [Nitratireductor aestuarii]
MKLYDGGRAPNPRRVRIFLAEKGIDIPLVPVDMGKLEHLGEAFARLNPMKQLPVLELDDGTILSETIAICRYLEELHPEPALFGRGVLGKARVEMWQRRVEFHLLGTIQAVFRHTHPAMKEMEVPQIREWAEANRPRVRAFLEILDRELAGRRFIAGDEFSVADITGFVSVQFMKPARIELPPELTHVGRWYNEIAARPSASA